MKKQYAWDQVDRLAEEWYATPAGEEHAAIKQKLLEEFLGLSCNLLSESMMEGLGDFWEQDFQRFDPALSPFSKFLLSRLTLRVRDGVREDLGLRRVKRDGETVTEGAFSLDDTGGKDADDDMTREVRNPRAEEALEELFLDERAYECLSLMLDLPNKLQGKANNPEKINYYRMFFTDGVTTCARPPSCPFWTFSWTGSAGLSPAWPAARPGPMASWWRAARTSPWSSPCPRTCIAAIWPGRRGARRACPPSLSSGRPIGPF